MPSLIDRDRDDVGPDVAERLDGAEPGRHLADDRVAPVDQCVEKQVDGLRSSGGDEDVFALGAEALVARQLRDQRVDQPGIARVVSVLQRGMAPLAEDLSGRSRDFLRGQRRRIRETEDERDALPDAVHSLQERFGTDLPRAAREERIEISGVANLRFARSCLLRPRRSICSILAAFYDWRGVVRNRAEVDSRIGLSAQVDSRVDPRGDARIAADIEMGSRALASPG